MSGDLVDLRFPPYAPRHRNPCLSDFVVLGPEYPLGPRAQMRRVRYPRAHLDLGQSGSSTEWFHLDRFSADRPRDTGVHGAWGRFHGWSRGSDPFGLFSGVSSGWFEGRFSGWFHHGAGPRGDQWFLRGFGLFPFPGGTRLTPSWCRVRCGDHGPG